MKTLIRVTSAIGGYFGGRLHQGGADVTSLVRAKPAHNTSPRKAIVCSFIGR